MINNCRCWIGCFFIVVQKDHICWIATNSVEWSRSFNQEFNQIWIINVTKWLDTCITINYWLNHCFVGWHSKKFDITDSGWILFVYFWFKLDSRFHIQFMVCRILFLNRNLVGVKCTLDVKSLYWNTWNHNFQISI